MGGRRAGERGGKIGARQGQDRGSSRGKTWMCFLSKAKGCRATSTPRAVVGVMNANLSRAACKKIQVNADAHLHETTAHMCPETLLHLCTSVCQPCPVITVCIGFVCGKILQGSASCCCLCLQNRGQKALYPRHTQLHGLLQHSSFASSSSTAQTNLQQIGMLQDCLWVAVHQDPQYCHKGKGNLLLHSH